MAKGGGACFVQDHTIQRKSAIVTSPTMEANAGAGLAEYSSLVTAFHLCADQIYWIANKLLERGSLCRLSRSSNARSQRARLMLFNYKRWRTLWLQGICKLYDGALCGPSLTTCHHPRGPPSPLVCAIPVAPSPLRLWLTPNKLECVSCKYRRGLWRSCRQGLDKENVGFQIGKVPLFGAV